MASFPAVVPYGGTYLSCGARDPRLPRCLCLGLVPSLLSLGRDAGNF